MAEAVVMPRQGQSVETCIITRWFKKEGEAVEKGEILFSYETDKAAFDEEAGSSGILLAVFYKEGDEVPVLSNVAVIGSKGEEISAFGSDSPEDDAISSMEIKSETTATKTTLITPASRLDNGRTRISPRARKMADAMRISIETIKGTGPMGRIIVSDIENQAEGKAAQKVSSSAYTDHKISNIRRIIAGKMHQSLSQSAQLTHHTSADARKILKLRKDIKNGTEKRVPDSTTLNDMVCYAIVKSLIALPAINAHFLGTSIRQFHEVNLGIAVDTERGLMVPSLQGAEKLKLGELGIALKELASSCKSGTIDPDLLLSENATFTVSNLGAYGVEMFTPVINLPQCGIMGINTIIQRPADLGDGSIGFIPHIGLSLTYDHRALDGAPASLFLQEVKRQIEIFNPNL